MIDSTGNDGLLGGADEGLDDSAELVGRSDAEADAVASGAGGTVGEGAVRDTDPAAAGTDDVDADIAASGGDPDRS